FWVSCSLRWRTSALLLVLARTMTLRFFFCNDPATPAIYPLSLTTLFRSGHMSNAATAGEARGLGRGRIADYAPTYGALAALLLRSEEHTSELQSQSNLVCRLLLEKKKKTRPQPIHAPTDAHAHVHWTPRR